MSPKKLRFGFLSTAGIGRKMIRGMRTASNCEVVAVASRSLEQARAWAHQEDVPLAFGSYEEMLASEAIDAVYVAVPNALHKEWAIRAAAHGKHILCEKPIALNAAEAEEMICAAEKNRVYLMEAFMYRFHPQYRQVEDLLAGGKVGSLKVVRATLGFYLDDEKRPNDIRWVKTLGGGALYDVGCYCVNALRWLIAREPIAVMANALWSPSHVDETFTGLLEFPGGVMGLLDCSFRMENRQRLEISGTQGYLSLEQPFSMDEKDTSIHYQQTDNRQVFSAPGANEYSQMAAHFARAVLSGQPTAHTPYDSLNQMRVIDALYQSARTGQRVILQ